jgi:spermidine synthase
MNFVATSKLSNSVYPFAALSLLASFLLFFVQPLIAKIALPQLGGNAAVWTSAMVAFQLLLLVGYGYAHWLLGLAQRRQVPVHAALFAAALHWLPLGLEASGAPHGDALLYWVPWRIIAAVGPLFVLLAAQAPLLQGWLRDSSGVEPYGLYRFSNIGSFLGLLAFPLIVEPLVPVSAQTIGWSAGFVLFAVLSLWLMLTTRQQAATQPMTKAASTRPDWRSALLWIVLSAIPSGLILSTTTHIMTDIIAMPLLWVLPLALYLLSFILAFSDSAPLIDRTAQYAAPLIAALALIALSTDAFEVYVTGPAALALLFIASLSLHRRLYLARPDASGLTAFYLLLAFGGAIGGFLVAVVAPLIFDWTYEFPLLALAAVAFTAGYARKEASLWRWGAAFIVTLIASALALDRLDNTSLWVAALLIAMIWIVRRHRWLTILTVSAALVGLACIDPLVLSWNGLRQRSYFGIYTVRENETGTIRKLAHGTTLHGAQRLEPGKLLEPTTYFGPQSGAGQILTAAPALYGANARIGVLGLGVGTLACYAKPGQIWSFYEIDPLVIDIARKQGWFTFLVNCTPNAAMHIGDARLTLAKQPSATLDILVMDVFSSDAVPTHLLTREAFSIYDRVLAKDGVLMIHISNRYLDLEPVLASEAKARGWASAIITHRVTQAQIDAGETTSVWVMMARSEAAMQRARGAVPQGAAAQGMEWRPLSQQQDFTRWTDEFGSILYLIKRPDQAK